MMWLLLVLPTLLTVAYTAVRARRRHGLSTVINRALFDHPSEPVSHVTVIPRQEQHR